MIHIKNFMTKMSAMESRMAKDLVLPISDARGLRDDIIKLLADLHESNNAKQADTEVLQIEIKGGTFK